MRRVNRAGLRVIVPVVGIILALPILDLLPQYASIFGKGTIILLIVAVAMILMQAVVLGEWGRVQEITLTYVVIHIWDDRRLIVPLAYFIDKPFQNWTRTSADLLGSVVMWVDYAMPLDELREALAKIIEPHPLWDKRFWNLQVTDTTEKSMKLRVLATTADSSTGWDLRCDIREKMISYIQQNHPECLPRFRVQADDGVPAATPFRRAPKVREIRWLATKANSTPSFIDLPGWFPRPP